MRTLIFAFSILSTSYFATVAQQVESATGDPPAAVAPEDTGADQSIQPSDQVDPARLEEIFAGRIPESIAELKAMEQRQLELAEQVKRYTVGLRVGPAHGSGVIISKDGYILTAAHVAMQPNAPVIVMFPDGSQARGRSLGMNRGNDAGMIKLNERTDEAGNVVDWPHAEMGLASDLKRGQWCFAAGHPGGFNPERNLVIRVGRILGISEDVLISDCPLIGGDSGGPLFDMDGKVIGIHSRIGQPLTSNLHVPVNAFADDWDKLAAAESWGGRQQPRARRGRPSIGVRVNDGDDSAIVRGVTAGGPAEAAGLQTDDRIVEFAGEPVADPNDLVRVVQEQKPGDTVRVTVERDGKTLTFDLIVGGGRRR